LHNIPPQKKLESIESVPVNSDNAAEVIEETQANTVVSDYVEDNGKFA
jgi:hypothetical protein